jgi:hypothetical protein
MKWNLLRKRAIPHTKKIKLVGMIDHVPQTKKLIYESMVKQTLNKDFRYKYCTTDFCIYSYDWQHNLIESVYNLEMKVFKNFEIKQGVCPRHKK